MRLKEPPTFLGSGRSKLEDRYGASPGPAVGRKPTFVERVQFDDFAGFVDFVIPVQESRSCGKANEIKVLQQTILRFIQQHPILVSAFAGFVATLFWVTIGPVGNSVINQPLINTGSEIMVQGDSVDKTVFTEITR